MTINLGINSNFGDVATIRNLTLNNSGSSKTKICQIGQSDVTLLPPSQMNTRACAGSCPIP